MTLLSVMNPCWVHIIKYQFDSGACLHFDEKEFLYILTLFQGENLLVRNAIGISYSQHEFL